MKLHGGEHNSAKGGWRLFAEEDAAREFAIAMSRSRSISTLKNWEYCRSRGWSGLL